MDRPQLLLAPWWAAQLLTGAKDFGGNPLIGSQRLNDWGLHVTRVKLAAEMAKRRRRRLATLVTPEERTAFGRDGYVEKRNFLPPEVFTRLREGILEFRGPAREMLQGDACTRRFALDSRMLSAAPELRKLTGDSRWRGLIRYVGSFDQEPLTYLQTIFTHVRQGRADPQNRLHADTFHSTVKAWFFLSDVEEHEGPLCYVPGSHRLTEQRLEWEREMSLRAPHDVDVLSSRGSFRISQEQLDRLGYPEPSKFAVLANTLVVADTFGFHGRCRSVRPSIRMEIWAYGRRNPFLPWAGIDLLGTPGVAERRIPVMWAFRDRFERFIGQPWKPIGDKRADER